MFLRPILAALALVSVASAARADDASQAQKPAPQLDLSRSVTMTGNELQAYMRAQILAAQAQEAAQQTAPLAERVRQSLSAPSAPTADK